MNNRAEAGVWSVYFNRVDFLLDSFSEKHIRDTRLIMRKIGRLLHSPHRKVYYEQLWFEKSCVPKVGEEIKVSFNLDKMDLRKRYIGDEFFQAINKHEIFTCKVLKINPVYTICENGEIILDWMDIDMLLIEPHLSRRDIDFKKVGKLSKKKLDLL